MITTGVLCIVCFVLGWVLCYLTLRTENVVQGARLAVKRRVPEMPKEIEAASQNIQQIPDDPRKSIIPNRPPSLDELRQGAIAKLRDQQQSDRDLVMQAKRGGLI